jgi:hypothetical protein
MSTRLGRDQILGRTFLGAAGFLVVILLGTEAAPQPPDSPEQQLADRYGPVIVVRAQEAPCDRTGEPYEPVAVDIVLDNPEVVLRGPGPDAPVTKKGPSASDLFGLREVHFLDYPGNALEPGCTYETDGRRFNAGRPNVVYAQVVRPPDMPDRIVLQYWFFWYFNAFNNTHESDWEGIQLVFAARTVEEALATEPIDVGYAQHEGGERAAWHGEKLEREGDHPVVYSSVGSHSSHYKSTRYLGYNGDEGFGCDNTHGPSRRLHPDVVVLPAAVDDPSHPNAWLAFTGLWGERHLGPFGGPQGPVTKARWTKPIQWQAGLRESSLVVPGHRTVGTSVTDGFCDAVSFGSRLAVDLAEHPVLGLAAVGLILGGGVVAVRRTAWSPAQSRPIRLRRRGGQILTSAYRLYREHPGTFAGIGLLYVPLAALSTLVHRILLAIPPIDTLVDLAGSHSAVSVVFMLLVGGAGNLPAAIVLTAAVAAAMGTLEAGRPSGPLQALREVLGRLGPLVHASLRALLVVGVLLLSIVGVPWGLRQMVRWHFFAQTTVLEGRDGPAALAASAEAVAGRWWHTAGLVVLLNVIVIVSAPLVGIPLLFLTNLSLEWLNLLGSAMHVLVIPYVAIALTFLYGTLATPPEPHATRSGTR